ncbi:MAG: CoA transferase [Rhodospirillales bacterium]|jgi:CoA:oxalate CoA-transferase|nr:CoA transferase [Rhodospirillales bacterium]
MTKNNRPLEGLVVLEFAQFLAGPWCGLRLADLGAQVIKIERPGTGDIGRTLYLNQPSSTGVNLLFQAINRNKQSFAANLKDEADRECLFKLIGKADVLIQNFRPGVMDRLGFGYDAVKEINKGLVYASISGFGEGGPWVKLPGQDLLAQARSGITWLNGFRDDPPMPVGVALADILAGHNLLEGILASLVGRARTGVGARVDTSLLEGLIDFQFELLTAYLNENEIPPVRPQKTGAHAFLTAPYGIYETSDSYLAIAMTPLAKLADLLTMPELNGFEAEDGGFSERDTIYALLAQKLAGQSTAHWLGILQPADIWCAEVMNWPELFASEGMKRLNMVQQLTGPTGPLLRTTRPAMRINGEGLTSETPAPEVGQHTAEIARAFGL